MILTKKEEYKLNYFPIENDVEYDFYNINWNTFNSLSRVYQNLFFQNIIYFLEEQFQYKNSVRYEIENGKALIGFHFYVEIEPYLSAFVTKGFYNKKSLEIERKQRVSFYQHLIKQINPTYGSIFINAFFNNQIEKLKINHQYITFHHYQYPLVLNQRNYQDEFKKVSEHYSNLKKMKEILFYKQFFIDIENLFKQYKNISSIAIKKINDNIAYSIETHVMDSETLLNIDSILHKYFEKNKNILRISLSEREQSFIFTQEENQRFKEFMKLKNASTFNFFFFPVFSIDDKQYIDIFLSQFLIQKEKEYLCNSIKKIEEKSMINTYKRI